MSGEQRVVLVTGAGSGLGWATARRFALSGDRVVLNDIDRAKAEARAAELGGGHLARAGDVADEATVTGMVRDVVERCGRLDVLVNNAGTADTLTPTLEQSHADFRRLLDIHLSGTFLVSREAARVMIPAGSGAIVNLASVAGILSLPRRNAYSAAKSGIIGMTRAMASEWAGEGIRVNAVAPGYIETPLVAELRRSGRIDAATVERRIPMGRFGEPEDIADAIHFLASRAARYITGAVLPVDGGYCAFGGAGDASSPDGTAAV